VVKKITTVYMMIETILSLTLALGIIAEQPQQLTAEAVGHSSVAVDANEPGRSMDANAPVITVSGVCGKNPLKADDPQGCSISVTKEQFERMIHALALVGQPVPPTGRRQLAEAYVDLLAYEQAARAAGVESSPEFQDLMALIRLRTLSEIHRRNLQESYHTPSKEDIDRYYKQNPSSFTEIKLRRILIPRRNSSVQDQQGYEKSALEVANLLRERAAQGGDFDQLQKEGYTRLGLHSPPATDMGHRRKANMLAGYRDEVFSLEPGGVSKVEQEAFSFVIYKVEGKELLAEETVKEEISREISRQRLETALKAVTSSVHPVFNQQYFSPEPPSVLPSSSVR
jgi:parvulin-like peptidyl-prolyl cis-trans isomerase-like protein